MNLSNILLLSSLVLPAAIADRFKPGLAVQIYVPIEAAEYATVTAKILGPEPETMSSSTFNETDKICKNNVWDNPDSFSISDFCMAEPKYVSVTRLEGITGDEVRSVNISMPGYNLTCTVTAEAGNENAIWLVDLGFVPDNSTGVEKIICRNETRGE